ncbi:tubulin folding cofactor D-like, putative [Bodo saltans]|uniref:Tubulin folding cofactor D-like, putative n=1 Tax=Bodo saltans TaxID=75058 RepID=A0A0S4IU88_BODSA|nr:tubulin folding cofactor D-like, putative [Bodo saltans]|eukprot:CUG09781.1 tubulin folding cofactor D-like, putative [Bodo saltans]
MQSEELQLNPATTTEPEEERCEAPPGEDVNEDDDAALSFFEERQECEDILTYLSSAFPLSWQALVDKDDASMEKVALFEKYLQRYQEYPQLVKPHIGALVEPLMAMIIRRMPTSAFLMAANQDAAAVEGATMMPDGVDESDVDAPRTPFHHACRCLYVIVKVAGPKCCSSFFSHDVRMFEDVCYALTHWHRAPSLRREWEVRYCLLLWLCNLILVPFAIHSIDSSLSSDGKMLSQHLLHLAFELLKDTSRCREAAALLIARLMARADGTAHREEFFQSVHRWLSDKSVGNIQMGGILQAVATTLKLGKRHELLPYVAGLIPRVVAVIDERNADTKLCKTAVKVVQRLGLCLLKQQSAPWRYVKAVASLEDNLRRTTATGSLTATSDNNAPSSRTAEVSTTEQEDEEDDGAECEGEGLEDIIGTLIECLSHPDTIVRWSAAKGVGRLCNRLPKAMADDVVDGFLEVFQVKENDSGWHGGMLAVAELCRRSILLPSRFESILNIVTRGLMYDVSRGTYSVGSHVRDAACYVCWSVARAYDPKDLEPYVHQLSTTMVIVSLFDREVNVRRAASAALQECVGRLGNFPNGIDLVTTMDFFSLATMKGAYMHVAPLVGKFEAYWQSMVDALVNVKLLHWDKDVRRAAAESLGLLAPQNSTYIIHNIIEGILIPRIQDAAMANKHGAIFGIAECIATLPVAVWSPSMLAAIANIVPTLDADRQFRGRGGEFIRHACVRLLEAAAQRQLPLPEFVEIKKISGDKAKARTLGKLQVFYEDSWKQILEWVQNVTVQSFRAFTRQYYTTFQPAFHGKVVAQMLEGCADGTAAMVRRGTVLALGALPTSIAAATQPVAATSSTATAEDAAPPAPLPYFNAIVGVLRKASQPEANVEIRDAETRRNAIEALVQLTTSLDADHAALLVTPALWKDITGTLADAYNDYAVDKRGDVGSYTRIQAMHSTVSLLKWVSHVVIGANTAALDHLQSNDALIQLVGLVLQQSTEKIDKVRGVGGTSLKAITDDAAVMAVLQRCCLSSSSAASCAEDLEVLRRTVSESGITDWSSPVEVFPLLVPPLLATSLFAPYVLEGIVVSVGGLSIHVLRPSFDALAASFRQGGADGVVRRSALLIQVAAKHVHDDRYVVPLSITMDRLVNANLFDVSRYSDLVEIVVSETKHFSTDIQKLLPLVGVLGTLCRSGDQAVREAAWQHALVMIASRYPKVRAKMGTDLYTALLFLLSDSTSVNEEQQAKLSAAMDKLTSTQWDDSNATKVRGARNELYPLLNIAAPSKEAAGVGTVTTTAKKSKFDAYSHLVHEAGY